MLIYYNGSDISRYQYFAKILMFSVCCTGWYLMYTAVKFNYLFYRFEIWKMWYKELISLLSCCQVNRYILDKDQSLENYFYIYCLNAKNVHPCELSNFWFRTLPHQYFHNIKLKTYLNIRKYFGLNLVMIIY